MSRTTRQSGAVSLFMVIFAILLMSIVTISFLRIMTLDQSQASGSDLAQSAYDSSQAGVEDAKRALLWYNENCTNGASAASCAQFRDALQTCNASIKVAGVLAGADFTATGGPGVGEVKVQQSTAKDETGQSTDSALDQAYTCVTMQLNTADYVGALSKGQSMLIPLVATKPFTTIKVEWYSHDDVSTDAGTVDVATTGASQPLLQSWPVDRPALLRTQYMQVGGKFTLSDFDATTSSSQSDTNTLFLYPSRNGFSTATMTDRDVRRSTSGNSIPADKGSAPYPTKCSTVVPSPTSDYACVVTLQVPAPVGGGAAAYAYLHLTAFYTSTHFRITLGDGAQFQNVQPMVDSTGRANDVFRRVQSRIDLYDTTFPYPDAAVDVNGNFCKDFSVTDTQYIPGSCTP